MGKTLVIHTKRINFRNQLNIPFHYTKLLYHLSFHKHKLKSVVMINQEHYSEGQLAECIIGPTWQLMAQHA